VADNKIICPECSSPIRVEWRAAKWSSVYVFSCPACTIKLYVRNGGQPSFPEGGRKFECPNCGHKATYQRTDLNYMP
jgi:DNA-directed RNA polymerase subunit RPC12/RpoP